MGIALGELQDVNQEILEFAINELKKGCFVDSKKCKIRHLLFFVIFKYSWSGFYCDVAVLGMWDFKPEWGLVEDVGMET